MTRSFALLPAALVLSAGLALPALAGMMGSGSGFGMMGSGSGFGMMGPGSGFGMMGQSPGRGRHMMIDVNDDGVVSVEEAELLRTVCSVLHCPLPPILGSSATH